MILSSRTPNFWNLSSWILNNRNLFNRNLSSWTPNFWNLSFRNLSSWILNNLNLFNRNLSSWTPNFFNLSSRKLTWEIFPLEIVKYFLLKYFLFVLYKINFPPWDLPLYFPNIFLFSSRNFHILTQLIPRVWKVLKSNAHS